MPLRLAADAPRLPHPGVLFLIMLTAVLAAGCSVRPGVESPRHGDEIIVTGRAFRIGTPVVLWTDPGGYDAYRTEKRFVPWERAAWTPPRAEDRGAVGSPNRFGVRFGPRSDEAPPRPSAAGTFTLTDDEFEQVRGGGWDLPLLQRCVDQFVIHYDVCGVSRQCFRILHDVRGLSVHFLLDIDGTIYQTLDLKEKAFHATTSNDRSIGIEIANIGAYGREEADPFREWYRAQSGIDSQEWCSFPTIADGLSPVPSAVPLSDVIITIPPHLGDGGVRMSNFVGRPVRFVQGTIQGRELRQYDLTSEQYGALIRLTAALAEIFPNLRLDQPSDAEGKPQTTKLPDDQLAVYSGLLGHYHIQTNKVDPGPAFDWDRVIEGARRLRR